MLADASLPGIVLDRVLGVPVPEHKNARLGSADFSECRSSELRAEGLTVLTGHDDKAVLAIVVEIQRGRDARKRFSWPAYVASARSRLECPAILLVICPDQRLVGWCQEPIELGHPGMALRPLAIGPAAVPVVTDNQAAEQAPGLAVLSAMAHASDVKDGERVLHALGTAVANVNDHTARLYTDSVLAVLPEHLRHHVEKLMRIGNLEFEYKSDFARGYYADGEAEGKAIGKAIGELKGEATALLRFLTGRGFPVSDDIRERVTSCLDKETLERWIDRASTAPTIDAVFD